MDAHDAAAVSFSSNFMKTICSSFREHVPSASKVLTFHCLINESGCYIENGWHREPHTRQLIYNCSSIGLIYRNIILFVFGKDYTVFQTITR